MVKNKKLLFIIGAYGIFWIFLCVIALSMALDMPQWLLKSMQTISSWTPTVAVLILFKKLDTGFDRRRDFIKSRFEGKKWVKPAIFLFLVQAVFFFAGAYLISIYSNRPYCELFVFDFPTVVVTFVSTVLSGASGEELGWRGFLFWEYRKEYGVIKSSLFTGVVWILWHIPLWFVRGGSGTELLMYIIAFAVSGISATVIMGVFYNKTKNMAITMIVHFSLNFWVCFITPEVPAHIILSALAIFYLIGALCCVAYQKKVEN